MASKIRTLIFSQVDFPSFLDEEIGIRLVNFEDGRWKGHCPFPYHRDNNPSFSVDFRDGGYKWYCYGCSEGGTVIEFFEKYYGIPAHDAIRKICEKLDIKEDFDSVIKSMHRVCDTGGRMREVAVEHIALAELCRIALRKYLGDKKIRSQIRDVLTNANKAIEEADLMELETLSRHALELSY